VLPAPPPTEQGRHDPAEGGSTAGPVSLWSASWTAVPHVAASRGATSFHTAGQIIPTWVSELQALEPHKDAKVRSGSKLAREVSKRPIEKPSLTASAQA
jgi:hypothetical protein